MAIPSSTTIFTHSLASPSREEASFHGAIKPEEDTIAAIAGGIGGAVSVVRTSGPQAVACAGKVWRGRLPLAGQPPRQLVVGRVVDGDGAPADQCLAVVFPCPASYTGEDVVEFHTHGGALAPREVLRCLLAAGARAAAPGEFTKRAFINGKLDLAQAEAVGDLIGAHSAMALHLANRQLAGALSGKIDALHEYLCIALAEVESRLDFPEEQLDWIPVAELGERLAQAAREVERLQQSRREGEILRQGVHLVIAGSPNVGKSSLLNAILGRDRAIVSAIPGTTRDTLEELAHIRGIPLRLTDTAGIRETDDMLERSGVDRSRAILREAQIILWVYDTATPQAARVPETHDVSRPVIAVANKIDLAPIEDLPAGHVGISALTGEGIDRLFDEIERVVWEKPHVGEPECAISVRHARLLDLALEALADAKEKVLAEDWELAALSLRGATEDVGRITGKTVSLDVLDHIFARFCIGK